MELSSSDGFTGELHQTSREEIMLVLCKVFPKMQTRGALSNLLYEVTVTPIIKPNKSIIRKKNYILISLRNMDVKILSEILANKIQCSV